MSIINGYIDESGSYGFKFANHETHFVVAVVLVEAGGKTKLLEDCFAEIRNEIFNGAEIKSSKIKDNTRKRILRKIKDLDFSYYSLIVDKRSIFDTSGIRNWKESFYKYLFRQLYEKLFNTFSNISIHADELIDKNFLNGFNSYLKKETQNTIFQSVTFINSKDQLLVQLADLIAGTINRNISGKSIVDVFYELESQNTGFFKWPFQRIKYYQDWVDDGEFGKEIQELSLLRADSYIDKHRKSSDPEIQLQIRVLEYLKEIILYRGNSSYVHGSEIVENNSYGYENIMNEAFLKQKIIAPLRDKDVLIASNRKGYKLPTCKKDIIEFFEMFFANINPMVMRIKACYDSVYRATNRQLDLLEDERFNGLKKLISDEKQD